MGSSGSLLVAIRITPQEADNTRQAADWKEQFGSLVGLVGGLVGPVLRVNYTILISFKVSAEQVNPNSFLRLCRDAVSFCVSPAFFCVSLVGFCVSPAFFCVSLVGFCVS